jgi:hypothetical protein
MGHPALRFWKAWLTQSVSHSQTLIVAGEVQVQEDAPSLEEFAPDYREPKTLYLKFPNLTGGTHDWKHVWFRKDTETGEYDQVKLHLPGGDLMTGGSLKIEK